MSIRLSPDGLSFWTARVTKATVEAAADYSWEYGTESEEKFIALSRELPPEEMYRSALARCAQTAGWSGGPVNILLDTLRTVLIPTELFDPAHMPDYLAVNNITARPDEETIATRLMIGGAIGVMLCRRSIIAAADEVFGSRARFGSPFDTAAVYRTAKHRKKDAGKEFTTLCLAGRNVYITVQSIPDGELRYCEALPYSAAADILYYIHELSARFDIRKSPLYVRGEGAEKVEKILRKTFKK